MNLTHFNILKATEGGMGQKEALRRLKEAGFAAYPSTSAYVGLTVVSILGTSQRAVARAERILYGR